MPFKLRRKKIFKSQKKKMEKARRQRKYKVRRTIGMLGQPTTKTVVMPYTQQQVIAAGGAPGVANILQFRANSIFDPDFTTGGHQPLSRDQWALFYNHYLVKFATITVTFVPMTSAQPPQLLFIQANDDSTTLIGGTSTIPELLENKHRVYRQTPYGSNDRTFVLKYKVNPLKFLKRSKYSTDVKAAFGSNPVEEVYFNVGVCPLNSSDVSGNYSITTCIEYTVMMFEPKELARS